MFQVILHSTPCVKHLVVMQDSKKMDGTGLPPKLDVSMLSRIEKMGRASRTQVANTPKQEERVNDPAEPDDVAVVMYVPGVTGVPKGVMISHRNLLAAISDIVDVFPEQNEDVYIAYLPVNHIYELTLECTCLALGIAIGFSSPLTLTDTSIGLMEGTKGDASLLRPTILPCVPIILERLKKGIFDSIEIKSPASKDFFNYCVSYKQGWVRLGFDTPILNRWVFQSVAEFFGGGVRIIGCGCATLSDETNLFIRTCFNVPSIILGYGLTETTSSGTIMSFVNDASVGRVGYPSIQCSIKLKAWDEGRYSPNDKPNPRGEILIGGKCVTQGYLKNEELTNEFFEDGRDGLRWFSTGDIGEIFPDGSIKIIDYKKELIKLQDGDYVSLFRVEFELKNSPLVEHDCVVGRSLENCVIALVVPQVDCLQQIAASLGKSWSDWTELCSNESIIGAYTVDLQDHCTRSGLQYPEIPQKFHLCREQWNQENGFLQADLRPSRRKVENFYRNIIDQLYGACRETYQDSIRISTMAKRKS